MLLCTITRSARSLRPCVRPNSNPILFLRGASRALSTLPENPSIYVFPHPSSPQNSLLTLLPTDPPNPHLSIGTCTSLPPTPQNFTPNPHFLPLLSSVFASHATSDPVVRQQAAVFASPGGFNLGGPSSSNDGAGAGGASRGGWLHVSDERNPPDWGRIAWPEDIFGSVEVDGEGEFVGGDGRWQDSGTYRVVTREGILGLTPFMRGKVVERLREVERQTEKK